MIGVIGTISNKIEILILKIHNIYKSTKDPCTGYGDFLVLFTLCGMIFDTGNYLMYIIFSVSLYSLYLTARYITVIENTNKLNYYDTNIPQILDSIISDALDEYIIYNKGFEKDKKYINAEEEKEILSTMINLVSNRISDVMMLKLEAYYNKDSITDIISSKIYMIVTVYVANNNIPEDKGFIPDYTNGVQQEDITRYL